MDKSTLAILGLTGAAAALLIHARRRSVQQRSVSSLTMQGAYPPSSTAHEWGSPNVRGSL